MSAQHSSTGWPQKGLQLFEGEATLALCYTLLFLQNMRNAPKKEWGGKKWRKKKKGKTMLFFSRFILVYFSLPESKLEKHNNVWQGCQFQWPKKKAMSLLPKGWNYNLSSLIHKGDDSIIRKNAFWFPSWHQRKTCFRLLFQMTALLRGLQREDLD